MDLKAAGFTDAEIAEYQQLQAAGFSDAEIEQELSSRPTATAPQGAYQPDPEAPGVVNGLKAKTMALVKQAMPWMADDLGKPADRGVVPPPEGSSLPSFAGRGGMAGKPDPVINAVPEWRQAGMGVANALPEVGRNVGLAGGLAETIATDGLGAPTIPFAGAAGETIGTAGKSLLQSLLLPQSDPSVNLPEAAMHGAKNSMLDAMLMKHAPKVFSPGGAEAAERTIDPEATMAAKVRDNLTRRTLAPKYNNPADTEATIKAAGQQKIDTVHGKGPGQVQSKIRNLSGNVDQFIEDATANGEMIHTRSLSDPLYTIRDIYKQAGLHKEAAAVEEQLAHFESMPEMINPQKAHEIKKTIYESITEPGWENYGSPPAAKARKTFSAGAAEALEGASERTPRMPEDVGKPGLGETNEELGKLLKMRPFVNEAASKNQGLGLIKTAEQHAGQALRNKASDRVASLASRPDAAPRDFTHTGSPVQSLDELFGMKYDAPQGGTNRPYEEADGPKYGARHTTHPDNFDELEASPTAKSMAAKGDSIFIQPKKKPVIDNSDYAQETYNSQMAPNVAEAESAPGSLMEGDVRGDFTSAEGYGQMPHQDHFIRDFGMKRPAGVMPEVESTPGTLMEGAHRGDFTSSESYGQVPPRPSLIRDLDVNRPAGVMSDVEGVPGTLMEGEVRGQSPLEQLLQMQGPVAPKQTAEPYRPKEWLEPKPAPKTTKKGGQSK